MRTLPVLIIALFVQRYIIRGLTAGATKGRSAQACLHLLRNDVCQRHDCQHRIDARSSWQGAAICYEQISHLEGLAIRRDGAARGISRHTAR